MAKMKVSELPKEEQQALISEANALGLRGVLTTWGVETLKAKIEELKKKQAEAEQSGESTPDETKAFLKGETDELPPEAEEISNEEAEKLAADVKTPAPALESKKAGNTPVKKENKKIPICHICRSKVIDGKCTGCGFELVK